MLEKKLSVAAGHNITVTATATSLLDLMDTAASAALGLPGDLDSFEIVTEDGDIRLCGDDNTPTGTVGTYIPVGSVRLFEGNAISRVKLIRDTGMSSDVAVSVRVGYREQN
jgi:hypothetical protein